MEIQGVTMQDVKHPTAVSPALSQDHADYHNCVAKLRHMAGLKGAKLKSIRESIRDNTFRLDMSNAMRCDLLENWPLRAQIQFLDSLAGLSDAEKSVKIYEAAYTLYKQQRLITAALRDTE